MNLDSLLVFCAAYLLAVASPGPGIAALVARVLATGLRGVPAFIAGFVAGDLIWFSLAVAGLAALAQTMGWLFLAIKWAGILYLLWLAWRMWTAPVAVPSGAEGTSPAAAPASTRSVDGTWRSFAGGLALTLGNPKVMVFFMALLPAVLDIHALDAEGFIAVALVISVVLICVLAAYALAAARARRLFTWPRAMRLLNRATAGVMAMAAASIATRDAT
jgi:threonine/homoserine/homoserine lactone efflux protein